MNPLTAIGLGLGVAALGVASFATGIVANDRLAPATASIVSQPVAVVSTVDSSGSGFVVEVPTTLKLYTA